MAETLLELDKVNHHYRQAHTLRDVSLALAAGKVTALLGRNGVGKSTLLKCVMGLEALTNGSISFGIAEKSDLTTEPAASRAPGGIGYVPQGRLIFSSLTVEENLKTGLGALPRGQRKLPEFIFDLFPVLRDMLGRQGGNLSGGQQQQLAIARALVVNPRLLILDEPTEGIQPNIVAEIGETLKQLNQERDMTIWIVEQKLPLIRHIADECHIMGRGEIVHQSSIDELDEATIQQHLTV